MDKASVEPTRRKYHAGHAADRWKGTKALGCSGNPIGREWAGFWAPAGEPIGTTRSLGTNREASNSQRAHFCETRDVLLHTATDRVPATMIAGMPQADRYSLQLIEVTDARFHQTVNFRGNPQYRARFTYSGEEYDIVVTDPVAEERLAKNDTLNANCILTLSMGGPYDANYYKFLAAVIEPND